MKKTLKLIRIIGLLAIIGFSMAACSDGNDDGDTDEGFYGCAYSQSVDFKINMNDGSIASITF